MTCTFPSSSPAFGHSGPTVQGTTKMGRARDNNANTAKLSLYIVKKVSSGKKALESRGLQESEKWGVWRRTSDKEKCQGAAPYS
jgi:hypothetical protein